MGMVPGDSLADDLEQLVGVGLTPYQALSAATRTPGQFIHQFVPRADAFGTIEAGKRADLVLLAGNPLADIRNVRHPLGVMAGGRWFTSRQLQVLVDKPVPAYQRVLTLEERFQKTLAGAGAATAIRQYKSRPHPEDRLPESFVNSIGYQMVAAQRLDDAIAIFILNTELYPDSANVYDSLGEAYADKKQYDLAVLNYRRSLAMNPKNTAAAHVLEQAAEILGSR